MTCYGGHRRGWIYYVLGQHDGQAAVKIGITEHLDRRIRQHKAIAFACHEGSGATETHLNERFKSDALGHEWFRPSVDLLAHVATLGGFRPVPPKPPRRSRIERLPRMGRMTEARRWAQREGM